MEDVYSSSFTPEQTVELQSMFQRCGFSGADWVDIPAWLVFTVKVPAANGGLVVVLALFPMVVYGLIREGDFVTSAGITNRAAITAMFALNGDRTCSGVPKVTTRLVSFKDSADASEVSAYLAGGGIYNNAHAHAYDSAFSARTPSRATGTSDRSGKRQRIRKTG